jgi:hypothetical protein
VLYVLNWMLQTECVIVLNLICHVLNVSVRTGFCNEVVEVCILLHVYPDECAMKLSSGNSDDS